MLSVERANSRECDRVVTEQHRVIVPEKRRRDSADRKDGDPNDRQSLDADVRFHGEIRGGEVGASEDLSVSVSAPDLEETKTRNGESVERENVVCLDTGFKLFLIRIRLSEVNSIRITKQPGLNS